MKGTFAAVLIAVAVLVTPAALGQGKPGDVTDMQALRTAVQNDKRALVASTLTLTDGEAKKFWPIYSAYQRDLDMSDRRRTRALEGLIASDRPLSDIYAKSLAVELLGADDDELKARRTLQRKLLRALPPRKAARYLQLESKIRAIQFYDIAVAFPLVK